ncbi:hypothetical protein MANES_18G036300v8 [Manihot esculenta]|uniref:EF-hand domain-containing protein n=3 Tax=Manihot esculenta TaxID=3983 RepID=A0A2C9U0C0_MANES|nr:hypothetical protein MANES_18G036300v8 [Manihot esculenta]KAG8632604.1 hypothetical protein MANES_18G036300v8 [Manihot esculenta]OAY22911.1 hypothetical protein MANES_18G036300v8 [Manihot esculenta]
MRIFVRYKGVPVSDVQLRKLFSRFDKNKDNRLSREEISEAFSELGGFFPDYRAGRVLTHYDTNEDGFIDLGECTNCWSETLGLTSEVLVLKSTFKLFI